MLYEGWPVPDPTVYALPPGLQERMDALLEAGDRDGVVEALFRGVENLSDEDMAAFKSARSWSGRVAAAHTVTREVRGEQETRLSSQIAANITVPVLLVTGEHSTDPAKPAVEAVAASLSDARIVVLQGQEHVAFRRSGAGSIRRAPDRVPSPLARPPHDPPTSSTEGRSRHGAPLSDPGLALFAKLPSPRHGRASSRGSWIAYPQSFAGAPDGRTLCMIEGVAAPRVTDQQ